MKRCSGCRKEVLVDKYFSRKSSCPSCGADLHCCVNCKFYSPSSHNKCLEPKAEFQRSRERANFCDYFVFREETGGSPSSGQDDARKKFEDLFRKK
jgi:hypothetical protein